MAPTDRTSLSQRSPARSVDPSPCPGHEVCAGGACVPCAPGGTSCDGPAHHKTCAQDGSAFLASVLCPEASACDPQVDACIPTSCEPGSSYCINQTTVGACHSTGVRFEFGDSDCPPGKLCHEGDCLLCAPGSQICEGPSAFRACLPDGSGHGDSETCHRRGTWCVEGASPRPSRRAGERLSPRPGSGRGRRCGASGSRGSTTRRPGGSSSRRGRARR